MSQFEETAAEIMTRPWSYSGLKERTSDELLLTISRNHSLDVWAIWSIFLCDMQFFVRRIEWERRLARLELSGGSPSTFGSESPMRKGIAEAIVDSANSLFLVGQAQKASLMIDGVYCAVTLRGVPTPFSWISGRSGAEQFDLWLSQAVDAANTCLPHSSARGLSVRLA